MPFAKLHDIELYYEDHGQGPAVVLAHGGGGNHLSWWQQVSALAKTHRVITFDHRGFGQSHDVANGPGPRAFADDLAALLDDLSIERAAVIGQSMGGWTVCGFASAHPQRTSALVLCDTTGGINTPETEKARSTIRQESRGNLTQVLAAAYSRTFPERQPALCFLYQQISGFNTRVPPDLVPRLFSISHEVGPIVTHQIPTLLLVGEDDILMPPPLMKSLAWEIPHAQFVTVPGAGHSVYFECAEEFNRVVADFLQHHSR